MKGKKLLIVAAAAFLTGAALIGCGNNNNNPDPGPVEPDKKSVTGVSLDLTELELILDGEHNTAKLNATVTPSDADNKAVEWSSSKEEVATVAADGTVTAVAAGKATITVTTKDGGFTATCAVEVVNEPKVEGISLAIEDLNNELLLVNDPDDGAELNAKVQFVEVEVETSGKEVAGLDGFEVISSDQSVVYPILTADGYFLAGLKTGKATITAKSTFDASVSESIEVEVVEPYVRGIQLGNQGILLVLESDKFAEADLEVKLEEFGETGIDPEFLSGNEDVATVDEEGHVVAVGEGTTNITVSAGDKTALVSVVVKAAGSALPADGARSFVYSSADERLEILGALEKYAVENKLTGLTLYGDGGYVLYNPSVVKGTNQFVPGFGFGILSSGRLDADLEGEENAAWKRYYHTYETDDPSSLNYMDDKGAVVGDLIGYVAGSYYTTFLNDTGDGYKWVGDLAKNDRPIPGADYNESTKMAKTWRIPVKTGAELKYATSSTAFASFNGREVALDDYLTPYKICFTQAFGMERATDNFDSAAELKGEQDYFNKTAGGLNEELFANVGVKAIADTNELEFTFITPCTQFYAMYYLSSTLYAPVPAEFITAIGGGDFAKGVENWGKSSSDGSLNPGDHWLSTGPYLVERWDKDMQIVFGRNENWQDEDEHYEIEGVHVNILAAQKSDEEAALKEFEANKLHACGIPSKRLDDYKTDPRRTMTSDSSTFKLNLNTCTKDQWESLFGVAGSITQTPKSQYWPVEPAMSNKDFVSGLSFALDRQDLAASEGRTPTGNYFGSAYMSDPENGVSYNSTQTHKDAVASLMEGTDGYGFSLEKAKASFKAASEQLIADGAYKEGDTIHIEIAWQTQAQVTRTHATLKKYFEDAFNTDDNPLRLSVDSWVGATWSDVYYNKMMTGQFDIGFGSISGNTLNPINFLEVLRSDNSAGFTLNWGLDTNAVDGTLSYNGEYYSFDGLWQAADQGALISGGARADIPFEFAIESLAVDEAGNVLVTVDVLELKVGELSTTFSHLMFFGYPGGSYKEVKSDNVEKAADQTELEEGFVRYVVTFNAEKIAIFNDVYGPVTFNMPGYVGFDFYFITTMFGNAGDPSYKKPSIDLSDIVDSFDDLFPADGGEE